MMTDEDKEFIATLLTLGADTTVLSKSQNYIDTEYYLEKLGLQFMHYISVKKSEWTICYIPESKGLHRADQHSNAYKMKQLLKERINETQSTTGTDT